MCLATSTPDIDYAGIFGYNIISKYREKLSAMIFAV